MDNESLNMIKMYFYVSLYHVNVSIQDHQIFSFHVEEDILFKRIYVFYSIEI